MAEKWEQRAAVRFCFLLGKTAGEAIVMFETAYKKAAMGKTQVYEWFSHFRVGDCHLQMNLTQGDPRPPKQMKTLREFVD
jgi:hypothetical protein